MKNHPILFVGAGPGDPELITVKGRKALEAADLVVFAGSLVPKALLQWMRPGAAAVDSAPLNLEEIVAAMAAAQAAGQRVVRLHTGDPSLYGAIAEQIGELDRRGIPWRIVPGVSAAFAAAAALGIEFTLPELTQTLILTRAAGRTPVPQAEALSALAAHRASMVIYLSMGRIEEVARELARAYGEDAACAVVYRASQPDQKIIRTRLGELVAQVRKAAVRRQAVIVVGRALETVIGAGAPKSKLYDRSFAHGYRRAERGAARRTAVWAVTSAGAALGRRIAAALGDAAELHVLEKFAAAAPFADATFKSLGATLGARFKDYGGHVFIMAAGIAVRAITPLIRHKTEDPAVVVIDEQGQHAISLLSGHLGGANDLARRVAAAAGAVPVITTATDVNGLPAIDVLARERGFAIENPEAIKTVNAALVAGRPLRLHDPRALLAGHLPRAKAIELAPEGAATGRIPRLRTACVVLDDRRLKTPSGALILRPPTLVAGIGCNRGTPFAEIREMLLASLAAGGLAAPSLARLASIALKSDEPGLLELAQALGLPIDFFSQTEIRQVQESVPTPSAQVEKHVGVKSVCEAAALLSAQGGALILPKRTSRNVTIAVARIRTGSGSSASDPEASST